MFTFNSNTVHHLLMQNFLLYNSIISNFLKRKRNLSQIILQMDWKAADMVIHLKLAHDIEYNLIRLYYSAQIDSL